MNYVFGAGFVLLFGAAVGVVAWAVCRHNAVTNPRPNVFRERAAQVQGLDLEEQ